MIHDICRDILFLQRRSKAATPDDIQIAEDLLETLRANEERCVGMAANMIGKDVRIIAFFNSGEYEVMFNPEIVKAEGPYKTEEGCLSLDGVRETKRYRSIKVKYQNSAFQTWFKTYNGFTAQIIQHEIDHLNGVII